MRLETNLRQNKTTGANSNYQNWRFRAPQTHLWIIKVGSLDQHLW